MESGGRPDGLSDIGGAAALFTGRAFGEGGMERPSLGTLLPDCWRLEPGIGGRRRGAGEAISRRSGGGYATMGNVRRPPKRHEITSRQPACKAGLRVFGRGAGGAGGA